MSDPLAGYEWDEDEPDPDPTGTEDQEDQDKGIEALARKVRDMENAQKAKEAADRAEAMRTKFLDSLPENQRGLAVVGLAGAEDPKTMKSHIEQVQALLKNAYPDATPTPQPRAEGDDADDDDDGPDPFAPIVEGTPAVPRPVDTADRTRKDRLDRIFEEGDSQAALELYLADSPVFGDKGKYPIAKQKRR